MVFSRTIVHLGNIGSRKAGPLAEKTRRKTKKCRAYKFVGIDLKKPPLLLRRRKNYEHILADFKSGLERLQDNSVSEISSEIALGQFGEKGAYIYEHEYGTQRRAQRIAEIQKYTAEVLRLAYAKLKPGGKIKIIAVAAEPQEVIVKALAETPFGKKRITSRILKFPKEYRLTPSTSRGCAAKAIIIARK